MAFLSIFPNTEGFTVVIPKKHFSSDVLAMNNENLAEFVQTAKKVSQILKDHFEDVGRVGLMMEGMGVDHAHIKLFPMHGTDFLNEGKWKAIASTTDKYFEEYEGYISSHDSDRADEEEIKKLAEKLRND
jgi:diadenosine tetraphosphate (Ap4A) HIT family hydrolase